MNSVACLDCFLWKKDGCDLFAKSKIHNMISVHRVEMDNEKQRTHFFFLFVDPVLDISKSHCIVWSSIV